MKYPTLMLMVLVPILLSGCAHKEAFQASTEQVTSSGNMSIGSSGTLSEYKLLTGNIIGGSILSGGGYTAVITGGTLIYSGLFSLSLPKNLQIRTNEYQSYQIARLDFSKDTSPDSRSQGYFKLFVESPASWNQDQNDQYKCTFGRYDEGVISNKTIEKVIQGKNIYITNLIFYVPAAPEIDITERKRAESDLCFVDNNVIYIMSVGGYDNAYIQRILNSLHFGD